MGIMSEQSLPWITPAAAMMSLGAVGWQVAGAGEDHSRNAAATPSTPRGAAFPVV